MRLRTFVLDPDGHLVPSWEDQGPSRARLPGYHGVIVTGGPGPYEQARISSRKFNQIDRAKRKVEL